MPLPTVPPPCGRPDAAAQLQPSPLLGLPLNIGSHLRRFLLAPCLYQRIRFYTGHVSSLAVSDKSVVFPCAGRALELENADYILELRRLA